MSRRRNRPNKGQNSNSTSKTNQSSRTNTPEVESSTSPDSRKESVDSHNSGSTVPPSNDPEWYARDPQLLKDAASIPFSTPLGDPLELFGEASSDVIPTTLSTKLVWGNTTELWDESVAGICSLHLKPTYGQNLRKTDPLNVCANAFYTHVRYVNSGRKNYDPADLMIYALAMADLYSFTLWLQRLYSYAFMYSQRNKYIGKALIAANGVNYDNIVSNLANFRYWLNAWINKISSFAVPSDIYFFKRRAFLYANYYIENGDMNIKDQLYQFVPDSFMQYALDTNQKGCLVQLDRNTTTPWTLNDIINYANTLMTNITGDEDFGLMSGDILKAYGSNIISLAPIPEDAGLIPVFDPYVLSQMKNATVVPLNSMDTYVYDGNTWANGSVMQSNDGLLITKLFINTLPLISTNIVPIVNVAGPILIDKLLSVTTPSPNEGDVVEATRLMICHNGETIADDSGSGTQIFYTSGTEVCVNITISIIGKQGTSKVDILDYNRSYSGASHSSTVHGNSDFLSNLHLFKLLGGFKYAPTIYGFNIHDSSGYFSVERVQPLTNLDNYTKVGSYVLRKLHECALLSLFYVPGVAKMVNNL